MKILVMLTFITCIITFIQANISILIKNEMIIAQSIEKSVQDPNYAISKFYLEYTGGYKDCYDIYACLDAYYLKSRGCMAYKSYYFRGISRPYGMYTKDGKLVVIMSEQEFREKYEQEYLSNPRYSKFIIELR